MFDVDKTTVVYLKRKENEKERGEKKKKIRYDNFWASFMRNSVHKILRNIETFIIRTELAHANF